MSVNPNWERWIFASISKHFDDRRQGVMLLIEGQKQNTPSPQDIFELRVDGPDFTEQSRDEWYISIEVGVLVSATNDNKDYHRIHKLCGIITQAFTDIPVYRFGDGPDDDGSLLGCLVLQQDGSRNAIQVTPFGKRDVATPIMQSSVEGKFAMTLTQGS